MTGKVKWSDFWFTFAPTRKWGSILYVRRHYGWPLRECIEMWKQAERDYLPGATGFLGYPQDVTDIFFSMNANRQYEEAEKYTCVYGCCSVLWLNGQNLGGFGPAGCPCDDMADPRDLTTKEE